MWILVPAYEPGERLLELISSLRESASILVVDDGSGPDYREVFDSADRLGAHVLTHAVNEGKAAALRTGFRWLMRHSPGQPVVCVDSDGQHMPADVLAVGAEVEHRSVLGLPDAVVLGVRAFDGKVPLRSRVGNRAMTALVASVTGSRTSDTQTGLRGYPGSLLAWACDVKGERFAYELRLLLEASRQQIPLVEVPIETVYIEHNASSHFRPVTDSVKVLSPLLLFAASSLISFALDTVLLVALSALTGSLAVAVVGARILSGSLNFWLNRRAVFRSRGQLRQEVVRYGAFAVGLLVLGYVGIAALTNMGVPLVLAKIAADATLWLASFAVQRVVVFSHAEAPAVTVDESKLQRVRGGEVR